MIKKKSIIINKNRNSSDILIKINNYNKEKEKEIKKIINLLKDYYIKFDNSNLLLLNNKNKKILLSEFIFFGIYQPETKLFIWASSIPGISKKNIELIKNIKAKNYLFENNDNVDVLFLYQLLTNDVLLINKNQFNLLNITLKFLSDSFIMLNPVNNNNLQFIGLTNIIEKYY